MLKRKTPEPCSAGVILENDLCDKDVWACEVLSEGRPLPGQLYHTAALLNNEIQGKMLIAVSRGKDGYSIGMLVRKTGPKIVTLPLIWLSQNEGSNNFSKTNEKESVRRSDCFRLLHHISVDSHNEIFISKPSLDRLDLQHDRYLRSRNWQNFYVCNKLSNRGSPSTPGTLQYLLTNRTEFPADKTPSMVKTGLSELRKIKKVIKGMLGVIAVSEIPRNYYLAEYRGVTYDSYESLFDAKKSKVGNFIFQVNIVDHAKNDDLAAFYIDSEEPSLSTWPRYINAAEVNCSQDADPTEVGLQNCDFVIINHRVLLRTIRVIPPGKELLAWYGPNTDQIISGDDDFTNEEPQPRYGRRKKARFISALRNADQLATR